MIAIAATATASSSGWVVSLTMTFMPRIDESAVMGNVTAAMTASRSRRFRVSRPIASPTWARRARRLRLACASGGC